MVTSYDEKGKVTFVSGKEDSKKARTLSAGTFRATVKGHKISKTCIKRISGRENRWMSDVNSSDIKDTRYEIQSQNVVCTGRSERSQLQR